MSNNNANHTGTRREDWGTPIDVFATLSREHNFIIDLCADERNALCEYYVDERIDIFSDDAGKAIDSALCATLGTPRPYAWINPPYQAGGKTGLFVARAVELAREHELGLVALLPASVGSVWWRENVYPAFDFTIFTRRLQFQGAPNVAQFDTAICVYGAPGEAWVGALNAHESLGVVYSRFG